VATYRGRARWHASRTWIGLILAVTLLAPTACSGGDKPASGKTEISFSYLWTGKEGGAVEKIISDFNASQDKIVVKGVSNPDAQAQLAAMSSTSGAFDISDNFGMNVGSWASKGVLEPLDDYIKDDSYDTADFVPAVMSQMKYDGKTYSLPIAVHSFQLLYNKKLLAAAGITAPPKTTSEWARAIAATSKVDKSRITQLGFANPDLTTLGFTFGGGWFDPEGKPKPDQPGNVAAASFYVNNVPAKYGAKEVQKFTSSFGEYASPQNPFFQGKVAMVTDGEWMSAFIKEFAPSLQWGVAPIPHPDGQPALAGTTQLTASTVFIPRNSKHKQAAWEFMKYLLDKKAMLDFTYTLANLPSRTSLLDDPRYGDLPNFKRWLESLKSENARLLAAVPATPQYTADLATTSDAILRMTETPEKAFAELAKKAGNYGD
jgi:multiple sugar transport system substrate-binding protein